MRGDGVWSTAQTLKHGTPQASNTSTQTNSSIDTKRADTKAYQHKDTQLQKLTCSATHTHTH